MKIANVVYNSLFKINTIIPNSIKSDGIDLLLNNNGIITIKTELAYGSNVIDNEQRVVIMNDETIPIATIIK